MGTSASMSRNNSELISPRAEALTKGKNQVSGKNLLSSVFGVKEQLSLDLYMLHKLRSLRALPDFIATALHWIYDVCRRRSAHINCPHATKKSPDLSK